MSVATIETDQKVWQSHCKALAAPAWERFAVKRDRHGIYSPAGGARWGYTELTKDELAAHFAGEVTIGCGATSRDDKCLWVAWDMDNHVSDIATNVNHDFAIVIMKRLAEIDVHAVIEDSDGKGGIHVWVFFPEPVPAADAYRFSKWIARDYESHGLEAIECFPKSPSVLHTDEQCGTYLRVPGKHHKREHWSRFWGDGEWMTAEESVQLLLNLPVNSPACLAHAPKDPPPSPVKPYDGPETELATLRSALPCISCDDYDTWLRVGQALHNEGDHLLSEWQHWSATSEKYKHGECEAKWKTFSRSGKGVSLGTVFQLAGESGWQRPRKAVGVSSTGPADSLIVKNATSPAQTGNRSYDVTNRNDIGNAAHFVKQHGDKLRYCYAWQKWLAWDGSRWKLDDCGAPTTLAKATVNSMFQDGIASENDNVMKLAMQTAKAPKLRDMISLAAPELPIRVDEMDANGWQLNCRNGTLDLRTGELQPHLRWQHITMLCPTEFDASATAPTWERFLKDVFVDDDLIAFVQRLFGYCLTADVSEQKLPIFYGTGANGKSTLLNAVMDVVGTDYTMQAMPDFLMEKKHDGHPTELAKLFGKRFVACTETEASRKLSESKVKMLTGGEKVTARRMREDFWEFSPTHKMILCTNHKPVVVGDDHGIWRRLLLVPFTQRFEGRRIDKLLPDKLRSESAGILNWLLQGCGDWQRDGLNAPTSVTEATKDYRSKEDVLGRFVSEQCDTGPNISVLFKAFYDRLERWCADYGEDCPKKKRVGEWLVEKGFQKATGSGNVRIYKGLFLLDK